MRELLKKGDRFLDRYIIQFPKKKKKHYQSYRLIDDSDKNFYLKIFLHRDKAEEEIRKSERLDHPNIPRIIEKGSADIAGDSYHYIIQEFISGETIAEYMARNFVVEPYRLKRILNDILDTLDYIHNLPEPLIHNNINNKNVMIDMAEILFRAKLISFGNATWFHQSVKDFSFENVNHFYLAPECFKGFFSPQSDLFSVGALMYHCLFGLPPWFIDISEEDYHNDQWQELISRERRKPLKRPQFKTENLANYLDVVSAALQPETDLRFKTAKEFKDALNNKNFKFYDADNDKTALSMFPGESDLSSEKKNRGNGFADIAGMEVLKQTLYDDVIWKLRNREECKRSPIPVSIPNGILLYGPPRCGKTFFAEKLAEEAGFSYRKIVPGDLASIYIHGTQQLIQKLFKEAEKEAPIIIYFDEIDGIMPQRGGHSNQGYDSEVNEFLVQMDNCSQREIFIIGATNYPSKIDRAILKPGRIDKIFYIPPPDYDARKALFELYMPQSKLDCNLDYAILANLTENYSAGDIVLIVNETASKALIKKIPLNQELIIEMISKHKSTLSKDDLDYYGSIRKEIENYNWNTSKTIGFQPPK